MTYRMVSVYIPQFPPNAPIEWSGLRSFTNIDKNPLNWPSLDIKIILVVLNTCQMRVITVFGGHLLFVLFMTGTKVYEENTVIIPCSCFCLSPDLARAPKTTHLFHKAPQPGLGLSWRKLSWRKQKDHTKTTWYNEEIICWEGSEDFTQLVIKNWGSWPTFLQMS